MVSNAHVHKLIESLKIPLPCINFTNRPPSTLGTHGACDILGRKHFTPVLHSSHIVLHPPFSAFAGGLDTRKLSHSFLLFLICCE